MLIRVRHCDTAIGWARTLDKKSLPSFCLVPVVPACHHAGILQPFLL